VFVEVSQECKEKSRPKCRLGGTLAVTNPGTAPAFPSVIRFFLSSDDTLDAGDLVLEEVDLGPLEAGHTEEVDFDVKLPKGQSAAGQFVIAVLDANNAVLEINEENNIVVSLPVP
jgi:hypothetical protein